jgi:hypothetical protein
VLPVAARRWILTDNNSIDNSVIKLILDEATCKHVLKTTTVTVDTSILGGYIASVKLLIPDGSDGPYCIAHTAQGKQSYDQQETINSAIYNAINFLTNKYGLIIMDPSFNMCRELEHLERALKSKLDRHDGFNGLHVSLLMIFTS